MVFSLCLKDILRLVVAGVVLLYVFRHWKLNFEESAKDFVQLSVTQRQKDIPSEEVPSQNKQPTHVIHRYFNYGKFCSAIEEFVGYSSIGEFGADVGQNGRCWLRSFENLLNIEIEAYKDFYYKFIVQMKDSKLTNKVQVIQTWQGFEQEDDIERMTNGWVKYLDPVREFDLGKKFDWVISLEVYKYVSQEAQETYIDNLINHAKEGIILSWPAIGSDEVAENPLERALPESLARLNERSWYQDAYSEEFLRSQIPDAYLKRTLMVFKKQK